MRGWRSIVWAVTLCVVSGACAARKQLADELRPDVAGESSARPGGGAGAPTKEMAQAGAPVRAMNDAAVNIVDAGQGADGDARAQGGANAAGAAADGDGASGETGGVGGRSSGTPAVREPCEAVPVGRQLAFPGAEGFGRFALGGRGGDVCHVLNLEDKGAGSLRDCVSKGDRTVVFDVAGWITLASNLGITVDKLTIAGQSAPGGGIGIRGQKVSIGGSDIVMRFVRVRRGIVQTTDRNDAMAISSAARNVIVDHASVGFGTDENLSMPGDEGVGPRDLTVQWTIIAWGLQRNNHSAGSLLTASNTTIHHSIYAFNGTRNPKARSEDGRVLDFVNNLIYGWNAPDPVGEAQGWSVSQQAFLLADTANGTHNANAVGNYFIAHGTRTAAQAFSSGAKNEAGMPTFNLYFDGNLLDGNGNGKLDVSKSDWSMVGTATQLERRLEAPLVCTDTAADALNRVLSHAGATVPKRDEVDDALVKAIREQAGNKIQDEHDLKVGADGYGELAAGSARPDGDRDGMPDEWERQRGLDPADPEDRNADDDGDGFSNLEAYLNGLAASGFSG